jgi:antibiotic biosynthesis monooxygenase (ABM) superfamily enzyme
LETNNLDTVLKQTLKGEFSPSVKLDMETQRKMRKAAQKKESRFVIILSIISLFFLSLGMVFMLPKIEIIPLKIIYILLNMNVFTLFIFFFIVNHKNRKEPIL